MPDNDNDDDQARDLAGPDLSALEQRLAAWQPAEGGLDRDRMLYEAGRSSAAASRARPWQIGAAAMLFALAGLGGLLAVEHAQLARERALLAQERARLNEVETALAARLGTTRPIPMTPAPAPIAPIPPAEPPASDSYLALSSRLTGEGAAIAWPDDARRPEPEQPPNRPAEPSPRPLPLGPDDVRRVLEL